MPHKLWAFLNSTFGVWVLSSVVLAWITKTYATWQAHKTASQLRATTMQRLDTEIAYRLAMAFGTLRFAGSSPATGYFTERDVYSGVYNNLENFFIHTADNPRDYSLYPEYRERTFRALLLELRNVIPAADSKELKTVLDAYEDLSDGADTGPTVPSIPARAAAIETVRAMLQDKMVHDRWRPMVDFLILRGNATTTATPTPNLSS